MLNTIGDRIRQRRKLLELTQKELSKKLKGVSHVAISQWESNSTRPNAENLYELSLIFKCEISWLLYGLESNADMLSRYNEEFKVPILDTKHLLSCDSSWPIDASKVDYIMTDENVSQKSFALKLLDDSMSPSFFQGDLVLIDPLENAEPGEFILSRVNDNTILFRKLKIDTSTTTGEKIELLLPINDDYPIISSFNNKIEILGVMVEHRIYRRKR